MKDYGESSASTDALFKENLPKKIGINTADVWMNKKIDPKKMKGLGLETSAEDDTLMGRLGKRMSARDYIDQLDLGTFGKSSKEVSDTGMKEAVKKGTVIEREHDKTVDTLNPSFPKKKAAEMIAKDHIEETNPNYYDEEKGLQAMEKQITNEKGAGRHFQMLDQKVSNFSDPIPQKLTMPGHNMAEQARKKGNVVGKGWNIIGNPF